MSVDMSADESIECRMMITTRLEAASLCTGRRVSLGVSGVCRLSQALLFKQTHLVGSRNILLRGPRYCNFN
jgi:hypothetical protein